MDAQGRGTVVALLRREVSRLRDEFGLQRLDWFGSTARDEASPGSDVDILVEFTEVPSLFEIARLQAEFEDLLDRPVDITTPGGLHPRILAAARADAVDVTAGA